MLARGTWTRPFWKLTDRATVKPFSSLKQIKSITFSARSRSSCFVRLKRAVMRSFCFRYSSCALRVSFFNPLWTHGRRSRGRDGGQVPPEFGAGETLMQIVSPQILSYRYKNERSVAFKICENPFSAGGPAGGAHDAPPDPLVGWRGDTPPHTPPHSARTHLWRSSCVPPEVQPDLRLWSYAARTARQIPSLRI